MKTTSFLAVLCFCFGFFLQALNAQNQVAIIAGKDNTLFESGTGATSNGAGTTLFAGKTGRNEIRRGLIAFNITGNIPAGSTIDSVKLTLSMSRSISGVETIQLFRVLADWGEGTSNAGGEEGGGAAATSGDATWIHRFFNTSTWAMAGGDFAATTSASQAVDGNGFYTWGSTPQMVADVQAWLDTPVSNFGWLLRGNESAATTAKRFDSREHPAPANRPTLTVFYRLQTGVAEQKSETPSQFHLAQNFPNPFSSEATASAFIEGNIKTTIRFELPAPAEVKLQIYNMLGELVHELANTRLPAGTHQVVWDAKNKNGQRVASGSYIYRLQAGEQMLAKVMRVVK